MFISAEDAAAAFRAGGQWRADCRREAFVSTPVTPRAHCSGEASMAATFAGTPLLFLAV